MPQLLTRTGGDAPAPLLVLAAIVSVQFGGALAATLIPRIGVTGSVLLRLVLAWAIMVVLSRPVLAGRTTRDWVTVVAFGASLAAMNTAFYAALARLPIGVAVTVEFLGPLLLAAVLSRRLRDGLAVLAACLGVFLISGSGRVDLHDLDHTGLLLALTAGGCWAAYILLSGKAGARFSGLDGLTLALGVASVLVLPFGLSGGLGPFQNGHVLLLGTGVALLSSVLPYSLELLALRRMNARVFGILLSLEPAVAALAGMAVLHQVLSGIQIVGMTLVVLASMTTADARSPATPADAG